MANDFLMKKTFTEIFILKNFLFSTSGSQRVHELYNFMSEIIADLEYKLIYIYINTIAVIYIFEQKYGSDKFASSIISKFTSLISVYSIFSWTVWLVNRSNVI